MRANPSAILLIESDASCRARRLLASRLLRIVSHTRVGYQRWELIRYCNTGLGALIGCVINFFIGDILGRRKMIWLAMGLIIVGATLQTSAVSLAHLIVGRIITGFGTGIDSSTVPMYQSELSKKEWRGRIVSWEIWFIGGYIILCWHPPLH